MKWLKAFRGGLNGGEKLPPRWGAQLVLGKALDDFVNVVTYPVSCLFLGHFAALYPMGILLLGNPTVYPVPLVVLGPECEWRVFPGSRVRLS